MKNFLSKCDQIRSFMGISSHLVKKSLAEKLIFCEKLLQHLETLRNTYIKV